VTIREMCKRAQETSRAKGFVTDDPRIDQKLMLTVGELAEAQEELRAGHSPTEVYVKDSVEIPLSAISTQDEFVDTYYVDAAVVRAAIAKAKGKLEGFPVELADAVIRIGQLAEHLGIDLEAAIAEKMSYNDTRPAMHGGKRF
jgi:hypothetical protein